MPRPEILVARYVLPELLTRLQEHFDVDANQEDRLLDRRELCARLKGKAGVFITSNERFDAELIGCCTDLAVVSTMAVGYNNIDVMACTEHGILVTNTPDVLTESTADFGFGLMMAAARRITESERFLRAGEWTHWTYSLMNGQDIHGKTLGILGMGRIGQAIARRGALGFGMKVIYHNRNPLPADIADPLGARWVDKSTLMKQADHLIVVVPYSAAVHHIIGADELALMKPTATLTNIARGGVVDDAALAEALKQRRIAAAALDVYEGEPKVNAALLDVPNIVLTPHIASATGDTRRAMANLAADNLIAALTGGTPPTPVNPEVLAAAV
ncbi:2-hydroxyacid dehydrogenase [Methyloversatilis thermotolerans]|uniref:2-hydroxyacid dehydrogenase n=1 Tax=Methyloversatilis thermotolerans TaxID=1346290 RepID=UPI00039B74A4|nr:D-glycerate dehydrogenase [Methyloversatilis thermotolerans]